MLHLDGGCVVEAESRRQPAPATWPCERLVCPGGQQPQEVFSCPTNYAGKPGHFWC